MDESVRKALIADYEARMKALEGDDLTDAETELRGKVSDTLDALKALASKPKAPAIPAELRQRVEFRDMVKHIGHGETPSGAWGELVSEKGLDRNTDGFSVPLALFAPGADGAETRADAATSITLTDFDANVAKVLERLFGQSDLAFLGISPTPVAAGEAVAIAITGGSAGETPARGAAASAAKLTYSSDKLTPSKAVTRGLFDIEGESVWPRLQQTMERDMRAALNDKIDDLLIAQLLSDLTAPGGASTELAHDTALALVSGGVDGKLAYDFNEIALLTGTATWSKIAALYRGNNDTVSALGKLRAQGARVRPTARIAAPATFKTQTDNQFVIRSKGNAGEDFSFAVWENGRLIVDPYTLSANGQIAITLTALYASKLHRQDRFDQLAVKTA